MTHPLRWSNERPPHPRKAKARQWLIERGVSVEAVVSDPGGNRFFRLHDLEGNAIEVCAEPGKAIVG